MIQRISLAGFLLFAFLAGCKKHARFTPPSGSEQRSTDIIRGLPEKNDSIHGFLFVGYRTSLANSWDPPQTFRMMYARFMEPATSLGGFNPYTPVSSFMVSAGNVAPGEVTGNNDSLRRFDLQFTTSYRRINDSVIPHNDIPPVFSWHISGTQNFQASRHTISAPFIVPPDSLGVFYFTAGKELLLSTDSLVGDFDSCYVGFGRPFSSFFYDSYNSEYIIARAGPGKQAISLHPSVTSWLKSFYDKNWVTHCIVGGFKYFHQWVNGRLYVFQFSTEWRVPVAPK